MEGIFLFFFSSWNNWNGQKWWILDKGGREWVVGEEDSVLILLTLTHIVEYCMYCIYIISWRLEYYGVDLKTCLFERETSKDWMSYSHCWIKVSPRYVAKRINQDHDNQTPYYTNPWKCYWTIYLIDNNRTTPSKD